MKKQRVKRGAGHHWWPQSLSNYWLTEGAIRRIDPDGAVVPSTPINLGLITGGHDIVFETESPWEESFEHVFGGADNRFPDVVQELQSLAKAHRAARESQGDITCYAQACQEQLLRSLLECLISLVVRSPKFRAGAVQAATRFWGAELSKKEQKLIAAANVRATYWRLTRDLSVRGKYVLFCAESEEFIFGDGFYNNLWASTDNLFGARMLVPITPELCVLYVRPSQCNPVPRLVTRSAQADLVALINETVQIYAKDYLFFRSQQPRLSEHFKARDHREYYGFDPVQELIEQIPGVPPRPAPEDALLSGR